MAFRKVDPDKLPGNIIDEICNKWMLLGAGGKDDFNFMTVSWGMMGELWFSHAVTVYVRDSRYTLEYMKKNPTFALISLKPGHKEALGIAGSKSGRDIDKVKETGLTPVELDGVMTFEEAAYTLVCETMYVDRLDPEKMVQSDLRDKAYPEPVDAHQMFIARITAAYIND